MQDPYIEKNRGFITSSKLKEFMRCQKCYKWKYEDELPDPTAEFEDKDHFVIGQALDDRITHGDDYYAQKYAVVAKRLGKTENKVEITNSIADMVGQLALEYRLNSLFPQVPKKKVITFEYSGLKLRAELDDFLPDQQLIADIKTCANLTTFNPEYYILQMSFYQWLVEETEGLKCEAQLNVVDKYKYFARSRAYRYTRGTLESYRGNILMALEELKLAKASGIYKSAESENVLLTCPFYGKDGHGRPTTPIIY